LHAIFNAEHTEIRRGHREVIGEVKEEFCRLFGQSPFNPDSSDSHAAEIAAGQYGDGTINVAGVCRWTSSGKKPFVRYPCGRSFDTP
jgi:hypothetical protein